MKMIFTTDCIKNFVIFFIFFTYNFTFYPDNPKKHGSMNDAGKNFK